MIIERSAWFGTSVALDSVAFVIGDVFFSAIQRAMDCFSYVWPSAAETGSCIRANEIGQMNALGGGIEA